jgi:hypothetical protein
LARSDEQWAMSKGQWTMDNPRQTGNWQSAIGKNPAFLLSAVGCELLADASWCLVPSA